jgi:hypothetical protein
MKKILFLILILLGSYVKATDTPRLVLLKPTGHEIEGLTEMEVYPNSSEMFKMMNEIVSKSVIKEFLELHEILQVYLYKTTGKEIEPAYLALTDNQGGFAKKGFVINLNGEKIQKPESFYVDINKNTLERPMASLMSVTQLYPHELGHIMYRLLSYADDVEENSKNVNIHFFSLVTDNQIAFNEGFAEHIENIARLYETNREIVEGFNADSTQIAHSSKRAVKGFERDFKIPLRIGFYRISMLAWYQRFEDYKRYAYSFDARSRYANASISTFNRQNDLIFRNSGVAIDPDHMRNKPQLMASEGTVSTFFTQLAKTRIKDLYTDREFYNSFVMEDFITNDPEERFSPLQNLFAKYFFVLDRHVVFQDSDKAQLIDFIEGYMKEFPEESEIIRQTYVSATGLEYNDQMPPEVWMLVKDRPHGILAMDAFASLSIPFYTFNLNAAEIEDIMMIDGISKEDAMVLLNYRDRNYVNDLDEIALIDDLTQEGKQKIQGASFDEEYLSSFEFTEELTISSVIKGPVKSLVTYTLIYFIIMMIVYFYFFRKDGTSTKEKIFLIIKYLLLWIVFVVTGLMIAATGLPLLVIVGLAFVTGSLSLLYKGKKRKRSLKMNAIMLFIILFSVL